MSYAVRRPPRGGGGSTADAATPGTTSSMTTTTTTTTTAAVLDYACLFTHDLKRKQKRWQDGRLKYHTFNRRIMVYDDRGNFVGDSHWPAGAGSGDTLEEGEELELDRGSAIVQVADLLGTREQDLTELLDKRAREVEQRRQSAAARTPARAPQPRQQQQGHFQLNHRPLNAIVPSPGPIGRAAIPDKSPFEARRAAEMSSAERPPPAKRRRVSVSPPSKRGFAQSLFGAKLTLSACPASTPSPMPRVVQEKPVRAEKRHANGSIQDRRDDVEQDDDDDDLMLEEPPVQHRERAAMPSVGPRPVIKAATRESVWKPPRPSSSADLDRESAHGRKAKKSSTVVHVIHDSSSPDEDTAVAQKEVEVRAERIETAVPEARQLAPKKFGVEKVGSNKERRLNTTVAREEQLGSKESSLSTRKPETLPAAREAPPEPQEGQEKRTALRIKSRQKRGLLMMTEQRQRQDAPAVVRNEPKQQVRRRAPEEPASKPKAAPQPEHRRAELEPSLQAEAAPVSRTTPTSGALQPSPGFESESDVAPVDRGRKRPAETHADTSESEERPPARSRKAGKQSEKPTKGKLSSSDDEFTRWCEGDGRRGDGELRESEASDSDAAQKSLAKKSRRSPIPTDTDDESDEEEAPRKPPASRRSSRQKATKEQKAKESVASGPRITKLARKSVKSREIIGFVLPTDVEIVPAAFATATTRLPFGTNAASAVAANDDKPRRPAAPPPLSSSAPEFDDLPQDSPRNTDDDPTIAAAGKLPVPAPAEPESTVPDSEKKEFDMPAAKPSTSTTEPPLKAREDTKGRTNVREHNVATEALRPGPVLSKEVNESTTATVSHAQELQTNTSAADKATIGSLVKNEDASSPHGENQVDEESAKSGGGIDSTTTRPSRDDAPAEPVVETTKANARQPVRQESSTSNSDADGTTSRPRIANPATRGKKAARKEDAAGQPVQAVVPMEPPAPAPLRAPRAVLVPLTSRSKQPELQPSGGGMAGFSRANGGTWSKHAEDLLGMTRPVGKVKR